MTVNLNKNHSRALQAQGILDRFNTDHPWRAKAIDLNHKVATWISQHPMYTDMLTNGVGLTAGYQLSSSVMRFAAIWQVTSFISGIAMNCLFKTTRSPLSGTYAKEMSSLIANTHQLGTAHLMNLLEDVMQNSTPPVIRAVCASIREEVAITPLSKRLIYEIRFQNHVTGYLIGTIHAHNKFVALDPHLHNIVGKCHLLITENAPAIRKAVWMQKIGLDPLRHHMDAELISTAVRNKIPIASLETVQEHRVLVTAIQQQPENQTKTTLPLGASDIWMQTAYLDADTEQMNRILDENAPEFKEMVVTNRNKKWLPELVANLKTSHEKPVCIAVGCLHCIGADGLVSLLKKSDLTVEQLTL